MDPKHRDRIAFVRVCSGHFTRDMTVDASAIRPARAPFFLSKTFRQERETVDEAWPGRHRRPGRIRSVRHRRHADRGPGHLLQRDSPLPARSVRLPQQSEPGQRKKYRAGIEQLLQEHIVQSFNLRHRPPGVTLLAAVGPLQFEVVQYRLGRIRRRVAARSRPMAVSPLARPHPALEHPASLVTASGVAWGTDSEDRPVILFPNDWTMRYFVEKNPELKLHHLPPDQYVPSCTRRTCGADPKLRPQSVSSPFQIRAGSKTPPS